MTITQQDQLKAKHQAKLKPQLEKIFRRIVRDLKARYVSNQTLINPSDYEDEFRVAIKQRIRLVANDFKSIYRKSLQADRKQNDEDVNSNINELLLFLIDENVSLITRTNENQLRQDLADVLAELQADNILPTPQNVSNALSIKFLQQGMVRSDLISEMLVQQASEASKETEVSTLIENGFIAGLIQSGEIEEAPTKQWHTIIDGRERAAHRIADNQTVPVNNSFIVGGEFLRYPSDPRGSIGNIARCRCSVTYS